MCGIFGAFSERGGLGIETIKKATSTLHHRGPDGQKAWISEDRKIGLGHARLSIIDLKGGIQPLENEDGSIIAVVNGELYDFERIRSKLQSNGHRFRTASDSEVLIHLYEDLGLDAVHSLRGEFAFIIWDSRTQRLISGRDRFGIKPLYYSFYDGTLYLASEVKALFAAGVPAEWDEQAFYISCHFGFTNIQNRTLFKNVLQVPPGHIMSANKYEHRLYRYWDFNYPLTETLNYRISDEEAIDTFRNYFEEAIKLRLRADVPVGVYLSGGLDSSSILGTVSKFRGSGVNAYSIGFEDASYDETLIAKEMADLTGAKFEQYIATQESLAQNFFEAVRHCETIIVNTNSIAKFMLSKLVRDSGYKVVLTGEGSDEILAGYAHFRQDLLFDAESNGKNIADSLEKLKENNLFKYDLSSNSICDDNNSINRRLGFVPSWLKIRMHTANNTKSLLSNDIKEKFLNYDSYSIFLDDQDVQNQIYGRDRLNQSMYLWSKLMLPNYLLSNLGDRMEMAHSVEGRVPFLDHKLVEFVTTLPMSLKIRNMNEKYILREASQPVISKTVYERRKHPFIAPPYTKKKQGPMFSFISEYINDNLNTLPFFDKEKIAKVLKDIQTAPPQTIEGTDIFVMTLASILALQEQFGLKNAS